MSDLKEHMLAIIRQPMLSGFATITEDGKPWVRYVMAVGTDDMDIRFASFVSARKVAQIRKNPEVQFAQKRTMRRSWEGLTCWAKIHNARAEGSRTEHPERDFVLSTQRGISF